MTFQFSAERHNDYFILFVANIVLNRKSREFFIEVGILKYTLTIKIK